MLVFTSDQVNCRVMSLLAVDNVNNFSRFLFNYGNCCSSIMRWREITSNDPIAFNFFSGIWGLSRDAIFSINRLPDGYGDLYGYFSESVQTRC